MRGRELLADDNRHALQQALPDPHDVPCGEAARAALSPQTPPAQPARGEAWQGKADAMRWLTADGCSPSQSPQDHRHRGGDVWQRDLGQRFAPRHSSTSQPARWAQCPLPPDFPWGAAIRCSYSEARLRAGITPPTHTPHSKGQPDRFLALTERGKPRSDTASSSQLLLNMEIAAAPASGLSPGLG